MNKLGLLSEQENKLDYVLGLTVQKFMERRLQTMVLKGNIARSIHEARIRIRHRHVRVGKQLVNVPSFMVKVDSEKTIDYAFTSPLGGGRAGRTKRKHAKARAGKEKTGDGDGNWELNLLLSSLL